MKNRSSFSRVRQVHPFWSQHLHPNHHCCQLLQYDVRTLLTSLKLKSESVTASRSTMSPAWKSKNHSSLSKSLKRYVLKTSTTFLQLDFQKLSHFRFIHKDNAKWRGGSSVSLVLLLFTRFSWDCTDISVYGSSKVCQSWPDILGCFARGPCGRFRTLRPAKG